MYSSDVNTLVREILEKEPLISPKREEQVASLIKKLQQKLNETTNKEFSLLKVSSYVYYTLF
jgi:hypothetical protein